MTTPTTTVRATAPEPRPQFRDLLAAEWVKLWSLRSIRWTFALSAAALILFTTNGVLADYRNWPSNSPQLRASYPAAGYEDIFVPGAAMVLMLVTGSIGAITVVGEYASGLARTTFTAVPARGSLMAAKALVVAAATFAYGALVAAASFTVAQAVLSGRHINLSIGHPGALRAVLASALLAPVCALIGMSIGAILRHTATTMVTTAALLLLVPEFFDERHHWTAAIAHTMPYLAWQRLWRLDELGFPPGIHYPSTATEAWIALAAWPLVAVPVATLVVRRRDM
ncbi:ABC transporter permease [Streptomyces orinoci]|uniref:ABC transporter permease n=1 Tax=Streptomyces orinoci TaxID=67339 RepID=A0ABV3K0Z5_STRON|nr:ABC transporter permease [Streptomyces orinoci]